MAMAHAAWRGLAALGFGLVLAGPLQAADGTPADAVRQHVARVLPATWAVEEVAVDPAESGPALRVAARVKLARPTFVIDGRDGPFTFLRPVAEPGVEKVLTGTATTTRGRDGAFAVKLEWTNAEVLDSLGKPAAELPGQTVVSGTEEAKALRARLDAESKQRLADEQARRMREEEELAEVNAADHAVQMRADLINDIRARLLGGERAARIATYEAVLGGNDTALRQIAVEAALQSRDPVLANLALRDWFGRKKVVPVLLYATKEDPNSETVLRNLGPLTLEVQSFNPAHGNIAGKMGAPGYSISMPSAASGYLAQTELTVHSYGCALTVRLTEAQTLDGLFRCQTLPTLIARITLD
ncbi:MAG TPA: hypothetical protein VED21_38810 [Azospirillum sp.]|nr:hypothetical protein [Azospirillum sp.]HYD71466.1 hypothetical protein [Azospirillum sp.]